MKPDPRELTQYRTGEKPMKKVDRLIQLGKVDVIRSPSRAGDYKQGKGKK